MTVERGRGVEERYFEIARGYMTGEKKPKFRPIPEDPEEHFEVRRYPLFREGDLRFRFNPFSGEVIISTWPTRKYSGQQLISLRETLKPIGIRIGNVVPERDYQVPVIRHNRHPDIESAIRGSHKILGRVSGEITQNTRQAMNLVFALLFQFKGGKVKGEDLVEMYSQSATVLEQTGFITARKPIKVETAKQMLYAAETVRRRVNPLISRTRFASAWVKLVQELVYTERAQQKFSDILVVLHGQRETERFYIEEGREIIKQVLQEKETISKLEALKEMSRLILSSDNVLTNPYRSAALITHYILFGDTLIKREDSLTEKDNKKYFSAVVESLAGEELFAVLNSGQMLPLTNRLDMLDNQRALFLTEEEYQEQLRELSGEIDYRARLGLIYFDRVLFEGEDNLPPQYRYSGATFT